MGCELNEIYDKKEEKIKIENKNEVRGRSLKFTTVHGMNFERGQALIYSRPIPSQYPIPSRPTLERFQGTVIIYVKTQ